MDEHRGKQYEEHLREPRGCPSGVFKISGSMSERNGELIMKKANGFTLVELLVTLLIGGIMMVAIYGAINAAQRSSTGIERRVVAQQDARGALELMAMEIRMASLNPRSGGNIWVDSASCSGAAANQLARGIQEATANSLAIEMDIAGSLVVGHPADGVIDDPNEIIRYAYNSANKLITRSTNCGGKQPFLGATNAASDTKTVLVENNAAGVPFSDTMTVPARSLRPRLSIFRISA